MKGILLSTAAMAVQTVVELLIEKWNKKGVRAHERKRKRPVS